MMIDRESKKPSVFRQCALLSVCRSGIYYVPRGETKENLEILRMLDAQYLETPYYGERRLLATLLSTGYRISVKRLRRLMRLVRWRTLYPKRRTTLPDWKALKYPYLLRDLKIDHPNQVWAIDITYIPMKNGFMYLFAVIDLYSRYVVGWDLSNSMTTEWCVSVLREAIVRNGKPEIINSDQGCQFTSDKYIEFLKKNDVQISMDGKGRALDNIFIERLWRSVKQEYVYLNPCDTGNELWRGLNRYFQFYNTKRLHQTLNYLTPNKLYFPLMKTA
jgi:putative transposase